MQKDFIRLVKEMREAQNKYFKSKTQAHLLQAVRAEAAVDAAIKRLTELATPRQGSLL